MPSAPAAAAQRNERPGKEASSVAFACVTQGEIAEILGVVARQVRNLEKAGLPREADGYPVGRCVRWYIDFKQAEAVQRAQPKEGSSVRSSAEDRKAIAEAGILENKLRKELGEVVEISAYEAALRRILFAMRREINNLVGILAPNVLHLDDLAEARRVVRRGRDELLRQLQEIAEADPESEGDKDEEEKWEI